MFRDVGAQITFASLLDGQPPRYPKSDEAALLTDATRRFWADTTTLWTLRASDFSAVSYPGGHGPLWHLAEDAASIELIGPMIAVGKRMTGFSNTEEQAAGLTDVLRFLLKDMLKTQGSPYSKVAAWQPHVVIDGLLITGHNPTSSAPAAQALPEQLRNRRTARA